MSTSRKVLEHLASLSADPFIAAMRRPIKTQPAAPTGASVRFSVFHFSTTPFHHPILVALTMSLERLPFLEEPPFLKRLPLELLEMVIRFIVPVDQRLSVHYSPQKDSCTCDATSLMLVNKSINAATVPMLYGRNTLCVDHDPHNGLRLFLQDLRDATFHILRRVEVLYSSGENLTHGLNLLLGCRSLQSLKIATRSDPLSKIHQRVLRCYHLKNFEVEGDNEWLRELSSHIKSDRQRTYWQQQQVQMSRQAKV